MKRLQRFKYEMFVRVRGFGATHAALFPDASRGGRAFARVSAATAAIDEHMKDHVLGTAGGQRIKAATRNAVFNDSKTIAAAARRAIGRGSAVNPFVLPKRRSLAADLATARAFMAAAATQPAEFETFGLPATFISDLRVRVDHLQHAVDVRLNSKTLRRTAQAGIVSALADGLEAARDLDVIVAVATRQQHPVAFAAWTAARSIEGLRRRAKKAPAPSLVTLEKAS